MTTGYMGNTDKCRDFVRTKMTQEQDQPISCSICGDVISRDNESNLVLVENEVSGSSTLQCMQCYAKSVGMCISATPQTQSDSAPSTPSAPRARNKSDVNENEAGCAVDAANAVAASFSEFMLSDQAKTAFQASPAMLSCDGMYHSN
jgi:hypothetical protein